MDISINWGAVVVAALANIVIGSLWYGPVFGKKWRQLMEENAGPMKQGSMTMPKAMVLGLVSSVLMANVLAHEQFVWAGFYGNTMSMLSFAFQLAFWLWLGFVVTAQLAGVLWEGRTWKLFCFNAVASFASLFAMALILTAWI